MHVAALPESLREHFHDRPLEPRMVVTDHENYAPQTACFKPEQKVFPTRGALPVGHFHPEHLAPALPINTVFSGISL
jgi:hypothetical protein